MMEGAQWRRGQDWDMAAWVTANLMNVSGKSVKKTVKPHQLLGKDPPSSGRPRDPNADLLELMRRQEAIGAKEAN